MRYFIETESEWDEPTWLCAGFDDVAIWAVDDRVGSWTSMVGRRLLAVDLRYRPWDDGSGATWCQRGAFRGEAGRVDVVTATAMTAR